VPVPGQSATVLQALPALVPPRQNLPHWRGVVSRHTEEAGAKISLFTPTMSGTLTLVLFFGSARQARLGPALGLTIAVLIATRSATVTLPSPLLKGEPAGSWPPPTMSPHSHSLPRQCPPGPLAQSPSPSAVWFHSVRNGQRSGASSTPSQLSSQR